MTLLQEFLALLAGGIVGFSLGLIGGGGSILAVPLLLYLVGMPDPHLVIGTTAVAVAFNAATGVIAHARRGNVRWATAAIFSAFGIVGAAVGSTIGKQFDGQRLLVLFALLMIVIALLVLRRRDEDATSHEVLDWRGGTKLGGVGLAVGALAGFFGIGGGFLIVPGLVLATGMPMIAAIGTSLVSVTSFGLTTAANYALSGLVMWKVAALFVIGGLGGGMAGSGLSHRLSVSRHALTRVFSGVIIVVALYMLARSTGFLGG